MLLRKIHPVIRVLNSTLIDLPRPSNISYLWNLGRLLGACLGIQIITGLFLAIHFGGDVSIAFYTVSHISRDVNSGWLIRSIHANGASLFFAVLYIHVGRGLYYSSFHFKFTWIRGIIIILILIGTAFLGYVLPWGQISFWGATVITNLLSAIPYVGNILTQWVWGGFRVDNATLSRFFALHFVLPFVLIFIVVIHIVLLHETGSSNPMGTSLNIDKIPFHPYFRWKDIFGVCAVIRVISSVILLTPYMLSDPENFIPANPIITPPHIQPEWYFLFAYAILRSIPNKLGGVIALFLSIVILITLPATINNKFNPSYIYPLNKLLFWFFIRSFFILTYLGACPVEAPYVVIRQIYATYYFAWFVFYPLASNKSWLLSY